MKRGTKFLYVFIILLIIGLILIEDIIIFILGCVFLFLIYYLFFKKRILKSNKNAELYVTLVVFGIIIALLISVSATYFSEFVKNSIVKIMSLSPITNDDILLAKLSLIFFFIALIAGLCIFYEITKKKHKGLVERRKQENDNVVEKRNFYYDMKKFIVESIIGIIILLIAGILVQPYITHYFDTINGGGIYHQYPLLSRTPLEANGNNYTVAFTIVNYGNIPILISVLEQVREFNFTSPTDLTGLQQYRSNPKLLDKEGKELPPIAVLSPQEKIPVYITLDRLFDESYLERLSLCMGSNPLGKYYEERGYSFYSCSTVILIKWK